LWRFTREKGGKKEEAAESFCFSGIGGGGTIMVEAFTPRPLDLSKKKGAGGTPSTILPTEPKERTPPLRAARAQLSSTLGKEGRRKEGNRSSYISKYGMTGRETRGGKRRKRCRRGASLS